MKDLVIGVVVPVAILVVSCTATESRAANEPQIAPDSAEAAALIEQAEKNKAEYLVNGRNDEWIDHWLADDFFGTGWDTQPMPPKPRILEIIRAGGYNVTAAAVDNVKVRVYGTSAVVTATQSEEAQWQGQNTSGEYHYTHVWLYRNGRWQVVAAHTTRAPTVR